MQDAGLRREKDVLNDETIQMLSLVCPSGGVARHYLLLPVPMC